MGTDGIRQQFLTRMQELLGEEYDAFIRSFEEERAQGLRFNTLKGSLETMADQNRERFGLTPVAWCPEGFYYRPETRPGRHPLHEAGVYYIQEPSAMAVVPLLDPKPGERVLDLCAAPGGKTTHIAERLRGQGLLVSNEIHPARAKILSQNVERMGIANGVVTNEDPASLSRFFPEFFDAIVVDAPCSGEGMFRKDEQARLEWSEDHVALCAARQQEILDCAAGMLRSGGRMVYSTCTFAPEEDEEGIAVFLERHPEFSIVKVPDEARPAGLSPGRPRWSRRSGQDLSDTFRIWPHLAKGEGHFLALLKKDENGGDDRKRRQKSPRYWKDRDGIRVVRECLRELFAGEETPAQGLEQGMERLILFGEQVYLLPEEMPDVSGLRVLRPGLHLGTLKKKRLEPAHALALWADGSRVRQQVSLDSDGPEILEYLKGNTLPDREGRKGWTLVCVDGYSIGWAKASGGVLKNHYPKGLRIP